jgi:hypothetical protein
MRMW